MLNYTFYNIQLLLRNLVSEPMQSSLHPIRRILKKSLLCTSSRKARRETNCAALCFQKAAASSAKELIRKKPFVLETIGKDEKKNGNSKVESNFQHVVLCKHFLKMAPTLMSNVG